MTWRPPIIERDLDALTEWLRTLMEAVPEPAEVPVLGTAQWKASRHTTQLASLARWSLIQLEELSPEVIGARLAAEIAQGRGAHLAARKQAAVAISRGYDWHAVAVRPSRAEVERRRMQPAPMPLPEPHPDLAEAFMRARRGADQ